ncbi:SGNH/GDSL hydrolase family protein [Haloplasma contractile]|uniref:1-alkyl-2-acetylglycerophosphocholine esterase protein n=1 Tax=Haloplasma contractile SSD-17B TaxID=1033810 RepID=U2DVC2_9MOLU|nr:GDSL-type esterase/lipase family protein [Haloplasma contractile]ERJ12342.1 1-alkyl-2-acetylglycerophosphocholine esterase protein [Haloplasma contractile SSD-17B]
MTKKSVFIGDSLIEQFKELNKLKYSYNQGVGGDRTLDVIARLDDLYKINPERVFLLIGINDILLNHSNHGRNPKIDIERTYKSIVKNLTLNLNDNTEIFILSILPVCEGYFIANTIVDELNDTIDHMNQYIKMLSTENEMIYVDLNADLKKENRLDKVYSIDGIHLSKVGYKKIFKKISILCNNL